MERASTSQSSTPSSVAYAQPADIAFAVEQAFSRATDLDGRYIFVVSQESAITLAGWVPTYRERTLAADIAGKIPGVRSVFNELTVLL